MNTELRLRHIEKKLRTLYHRHYAAYVRRAGNESNKIIALRGTLRRLSDAIDVGWVSRPRAGKRYIALSVTEYNKLIRFLRADGRTKR